MHGGLQLLKPLAALALVVVALPAAAAAQTVKTAAIGNLSLAYDAAKWSVEGDGGTITITCIAAACGGAVLTATATLSVERCDDRVPYERLKEAFPGLRYAVNMQVIGDLAVYFGEAGAEPWSFDVGDAVFACLDREGTRYEFVTSDRQARRPGGYEGEVLALLRGLSSPPAEEHVLPIGGVELRYTGDRWTAPQPEPGWEDNRGTLLLTCLPPFCRDAAPLYLTMVPAAEDRVCSMLARETWNVERDTVTAGGLTITVTTMQSGCRAWSPDQYAACFVHDGMAYSVWTGLDGGCIRGRGYVTEDLFLDLVRTLAPSQ